MKAALRSVLAIVLGVVAAIVIIFAGETVKSLFYPPPQIDPDKVRDFMAVREVMAGHFSGLPTPAFAILVTSWGFAAFGGAALAARITTWAPVAHGLVVGIFVQEGAVANMRTIPYPDWVWTVALALFVPAAYAGTMYVEMVRKTPAPPGS